MKRNKKLLRGISGMMRKKQVKEGFFDGRFVCRIQESKKIYTRKERFKIKYIYKTE